MKSSNSIAGQLETFGNSIIEAVIQDLSRPEMEVLIKNNAVALASRIVGRDLNNAFMRPIIDSFIDSHMDEIYDSLKGYIDLTLSEPPDSVDESASILKEEINTKVDSFADKLKARLQKRKDNN